MLDGDDGDDNDNDYHDDDVDDDVTWLLWFAPSLKVIASNLCKCQLETNFSPLVVTLPPTSQMSRREGRGQ